MEKRGVSLVLIILLIFVFLIAGCSHGGVTETKETEKTKTQVQEVTSTTSQAEAKSKEEQEELVPITLQVIAPNTNELELLFPVFWSQLRMPPIRMVKNKDNKDIFTTIVQLPKNSLMRYQYIDPEKSWEQNEQIKKDFEPNRMVHVTSPLTFYDRIYQFGIREGESSLGPIKLYGRVTDKNGQAILDAVIVADGIIAFPDGFGSYEIKVRPGKHQVIAYLLDGSYKTQSQEVEINKETELNFQLERALLAKVKIKVDADPPQHHKVRIYTSAEQTGPRFLYSNRFLTENFKTFYTDEIFLDLYDGQYVDYLYSIGNPDISYENKNGQHVIRKFIARDGLVINDKVGNFLGNNKVTLNVRVPSYTSREDVIGVSKIHPTLLFMHPKGNNEWILDASSQDNLLNSEYKYYKTFDGDGDEKTKIRVINSARMNDDVDSWLWQSKPVEVSTYSAPEIKNKFEIFIHTYDYYSTSISTFIDSQLKRMSEKGFHGVVLSQIWSYETLEPLPKLSRHVTSTLYTPPYELRRLTKNAHEKGLRVILYPQLVGAEAVLNNPKVFDEKWWNKWLDEIMKFNIYNAITAQEAGIEYLAIQSRYPGMDMPESFQPEYNRRMQEIISRMRQVYGGKIMTFPLADGSLDYWKDGDILTESVSDDLGLKEDASQSEIDVAVESLLNSRYKPFYEQSRKPFYIRLGYESRDGAVSGPEIPENLDPDEIVKRFPLDVEEQRRIYEAFYKAANDRDWIGGVMIFTYGFTDRPEDRGIDIRAKPAEDISSVWAKKIKESK